MTDQHRVSRREALKRLAAATVAPMAAGIGSLARHPLVPDSGQGPWRPLVLDPHQTDTVAALAEAIIPETDTPGAAAALVHQFIDFDLSEGTAADRETFQEGLARLDDAGRRRFGAAFVDIDASARAALLTEMAGADPGGTERAFFEDVKRRTVTGYYTSRIGQREELGYTGNAFLERFDGCTHPEHLRWEPGADR